MHRSRLALAPRFGSPLVLTAALAVASLSGCRSSRAATGGGPPSEDAVERDGFVVVEGAPAAATPDVVETTGRIAYDEDHVARVVVPVAGRAVRVLVRIGDRVKRGQTLAIVHSVEVAQAIASQAQSHAALAQASQSFARAKRLLDSGAGSERELEEARTAVETAKSAEERDQAVVRLLSPESSRPSAVYELTAPIDGVVTERNLTVGGEARPDGEPAFVVADLGHVWAFADVFEQDLASVRAEAPIEVRVSAYPDALFRGQVQHVGDTVDPATRTVRARAVLDNADGRLKPGMSARVTIAVEAPAKVRIPTSAVVTKADDAYVYVERAPGRFEPRKVVRGATRGGEISILQGLAAGDRIIVKGALLIDASMNQAL